MIALLALAFQIHLALGGHDGLNIVGLPQRFHPHIVIHAQQNVFRIRTGKEVHLEKKATEREPVRQDDMPPAVCSAQCSVCPPAKLPSGIKVPFDR